jgi:hypothetical protein
MKPHDQFAKNYLEQLLSPLGTVEISKEVRFFGLCYAIDEGYKG